jgi:hypothetical protein
VVVRIPTPATIASRLLIRHRPFRAAHHTISYADLVGGGRWPKPGEISLTLIAAINPCPQQFFDEFSWPEQPKEDPACSDGV